VLIPNRKVDGEVQFCYLKSNLITEAETFFYFT